MFLIVGLGNPGNEYENTRHNVGFMLLDEIAQEAQCEVRQAKFHGSFGRGTWHGHDLALLKPLTYMNRSGSSVLDALTFFKLTPENLVVVFDDLDQEPGAVRMRVGGGHGGHNGVRDILAKLGKDNFFRIKIGIGKPEHKTATASWVLSRFSQAESAALSETSFPTAKQRLLEILKRPR